MPKAKTEQFIFFILVFAGIAALLYWFLHDPVKGFSESVPGLDNRPPKDSTNMELVKIGEKFTFYNEFETSLTGKWPRFRGADF
ncbi:MAG: hypothetical protein K9H16_09870, partial [Bacteroidales bacterium]|nr:hypothetical protein [Bacteroidales bacterium]